MRVIVQDIATGLYLAENGAWLTQQAAARDFRTLLRAFHFATENVGCRFQVLLFSADDGYVACIIEGEGKAAAPSAGETVATPAVENFHRQASAGTFMGFSRCVSLDATRNHLN